MSEVLARKAKKLFFPTMTLLQQTNCAPQVPAPAALQMWGHELMKAVLMTLRWEQDGQMLQQTQTATAIFFWTAVR